jgi:hypothetical protein
MASIMPSRALAIAVTRASELDERRNSTAANPSKPTATTVSRIIRLMETTNAKPLSRRPVCR